MKRSVVPSATPAGSREQISCSFDNPVVCLQITISRLYIQAADFVYNQNEEAYMVESYMLEY